MDYIKFGTTKNEIDLFFDDICNSADDSIMEVIFGKVKNPDIRKDNLDVFHSELNDSYWIASTIFTRDVPEEPDYDGDEISYEDDMYYYEKDVEEYAFDVKDAADQLYVVLNDMVYSVRMVDRYTNDAVMWLREKVELLKTFYDHLSKYRYDETVGRVYGLLRNDFNWDGIGATVEAYVSAIVESARNLKLQVDYVERYAGEILEDPRMVKSLDSSFIEMRYETVFSKYTMDLDDVINFGNKLTDRLLAYMYIVNRDTDWKIGNLVER